MQTNLKEALKNADGIKSPMGDVACYSMNFAELASEINVHLEGNKVKFTWLNELCGAGFGDKRSS